MFAGRRYGGATQRERRAKADAQTLQGELFALLFLPLNRVSEESKRCFWGKF